MTHLKSGLAGLLILGTCFGCLPDKSDESPEPPSAQAENKARLERVAKRDAALKPFHDRCVERFVKSPGAGVGRMILPGHYPDGYDARIELATAEQQDNRASPWHMEKVELVSLLKNAKPGIYTALLTMKGLQRASKLRDPDEFETQALSYLQAGERLMVSELPGQIRMLGAIRMRNECRRCHDGPEGTLLGAFTYSLKPGQAPVAPRKP